MHNQDEPRYAHHPSRGPCLRGIAAARAHRSAAPAALAQLGTPRRVPQPDAGHDPHRDPIRAPSRGHSPPRRARARAATILSVRPRGDGALCAMGRDVPAAAARRLDRDRRTARASPLGGRRVLARTHVHLRLGRKQRRQHALHLLGGFRRALRVPRRANARPAAQNLGRLPAAGNGYKRPIDGRPGSNLSLPCFAACRGRGPRRAVAAWSHLPGALVGEWALPRCRRSPQRALHVQSPRVRRRHAEARVPARSHASNGHRPPPKLSAERRCVEGTASGLAPGCREALCQLAGDPHGARPPPADLGRSAA
jgi:hypothetical protein